MIYFTSDLHLGHGAIIRMRNRPFVDVEEMNQKLIDNYNSVVRQKDMVYILGDICHRMRVEDANQLISRLNGKKILISGNHDKKYDRDLFDEICDFKTLSLHGHYFVLMHYPMLSWPKMYQGSIHLHGHVHGSAENNQQNQQEGIYRYDVGVYANDFYPVSIETVLKDLIRG